MSEGKDQRKLQLAAGLLLILAVIGVERMAVRPVGVYLFTEAGAKPFAPGLDRERVLDRINGVKSIRKMETCAPDSRIALTSRRGFTMTREMIQSRAWILTDRQKGMYWLRFDLAGCVDRVLFLNEPDRDGQSEFISAICDPDFFHAPETFITSRTGYRIFSR